MHCMCFCWLLWLHFVDCSLMETSFGNRALSSSYVVSLLLSPLLMSAPMHLDLAEAQRSQEEQEHLTSQSRIINASTAFRKITNLHVLQVLQKSQVQVLQESAERGQVFSSPNLMIHIEYDPTPQSPGSLFWSDVGLLYSKIKAPTSSQGRVHKSNAFCHHASEGKGRHAHTHTQPT